MVRVFFFPGCNPTPPSSFSGYETASSTQTRGSLVSDALHIALLHDLGGNHHRDSVSSSSGGGVEEQQRLWQKALGSSSSVVQGVVQQAAPAGHQARRAGNRSSSSHNNNPRRQPGYISSTQELQLVSVWLCQDCRTIARFHARIARGSPRRLWCPLSTRRATRGQRRRSGSLDGSPRLPPLRLTSVTWERTIR